MNQRLKLALSIMAFLPVIFACSQPALIAAPLPYRPPPTPISADLVEDTAPTLADGQLQHINVPTMRDQVQWVNHGEGVLVFGGDQGFSILNAQTLAEVNRWPAAPQWLVASSPLTSTIAFVENYDTPYQITVLDGLTQRILHKLHITASDVAHQLALSPDGRWLAVSIRSVPKNQIAIFDLHSGRRAISFSVADNPQGLHFSTDSTSLFAYEEVPKEGSSFIRLQKIALPTGTLTQRDVDRRAYELLQAEISPDNQMIRLSDFQCRLTVLEIATTKAKSMGADCSKPISSSAFSADGSRVAAGDENGVLKLFNTLQFTESWSVQAYNSAIEQIQFSPDQKLIFTASKFEGVKQWSAGDVALLRIIDPYAHTISLSPDGDKLLTIGSGYLKVWDVKTGQLLRAHHQYGFRAKTVYYSPSGKRIAYELDDLVLIRDAQSGALAAQCALALPKTLLGFSSAGEHFVLYENYNTIVEYNAQTCRPEHSFTIPFTLEDQRNQGFGYHAEKAILALPEPGLTLNLYNAMTGVNIGRFTQPRQDGAPVVSTSEWFQQIAISPNGKYVAVASREGKVYLWEIASGKQMAVTNAETRLRDLAFLSDNQRVVLGAAMDSDSQGSGMYLEMSLLVWDLKSGTLRPMLIGRGRDVALRSFAIDEANGRIITESNDELLRIWDLSTSRLLNTQKLDRAENDGIVALRPDGKQLIIQDDTQLKLVDVP